MQQPPISEVLYGDGPNVRPANALDLFLGDCLDAERAADGVWVVTFPKEPEQ